MSTLPAVLDLSPIRPENPAELGFPPMLPVELAMRTAPVPDICAAYGITKADLEVLVLSPLFIQAYNTAVDALKKEGMSFKFKAQLAAEEALKHVYKLAVDKDTPSSVKLESAKSLARWAGYEQKEGAAGSTNNFQINIDLK